MLSRYELVHNRAYSFQTARPSLVMLVGKSRKPRNPAELARFPLIEAGWRSNDAEAPNCRQREVAARRYHQHVPDLSGLVSLNFREELHAIEAAVSEQGIATCSDLLVAPELASGALVKLTNVTMPGCSFYIVHRASHPRWLRSKPSSLGQH